MQRREGSPFTGLWTVVIKEMKDHFSGIRMKLIFGLVLLTAFGAVYAAAGRIGEATGQDPFLFLHMFTVASDPLPSFVAFLGFVVPLAAITLGFDAVNSEYNRRTLSRVLAQPIYRDALLLGKFLAALFAMAIVLVVLWLVVIGSALLLLGVPPSGEEVLRTLSFLIATIAYAGVWLILASLFSVLFRQPATSALASLAVWLLFSVFWTMITGIVAQAFEPGLQRTLAQMWVGRISPNTLFREVTVGLLNPSTRSLGPIFRSQLQGAVMGAPLPVGQSLLLVWPHITALISAMVLLFAGTYVIFQRQEIRA